MDDHDNMDQIVQGDVSNLKKSHQPHILQESDLNKSNKSNDPGNEADAQSEANDLENGDERDQTLDNEKI